MWSAFPKNFCPSAHIGGQVLTSEGQTRSLGTAFTRRFGLLKASKLVLCRNSPSATQFLEWLYSCRAFTLSRIAYARRTFPPMKCANLQSEIHVLRAAKMRPVRLRLCGLDILVEVKQIRRIIPPLEGRQPRIRGRGVGLVDALLSLV